MTLDRASVLQWRDHFPITEECVFLDHAFAGPLSRDSVEAVIRATETHARGASRTFEALIGETDRVRELYAGFIGATREEVAIVNTTSMAISTVASGIRWRPGDSVVIPEIEYLSNVYPWLNLQRYGVEVRKVPANDGRAPVGDLIDACDSGTRVMAISWVQFSNGYRADIEALGEFCRSRDILFVVDGNHAVGILTVDVGCLPIDILATQSFKWMMGPYNVAWLYVRRDLIEAIQPLAAGPLSAKPGDSFLDHRFELWSDARRFETGVPNFAGIIGVGASLELLLQVGMTNVEERVFHLTDYLIDGLSSRGYRVLSPHQSRDERSGIVVFRHPQPEAMELPDPNALPRSGNGKEGVRSRGLDREGTDPWHAGLRAHLAAAGIVVSMREGAIRVSPHFYNTEEEIDQLLEALP